MIKGSGSDRQSISQNPTSSQTQTARDQGILQGRTPSTKSGKTLAIAPLSKATTMNIAGSYASLLSNNPAPPNQISSNDSNILEPSEIDLTDQSSVWKHAMSLATSGKASEAAHFFKIHEELAVSKRKTVEMTSQTPTMISTLTSVSNNNQLGKIGDAFSEGGITFIPGAITSHMDIGFTPYFDKNLRELKGPIPLTIVN